MSGKTRLHVANSVDELYRMSTQLPKVLNPKAYLNTAETVFKKGEDNVTMGDEETAYVMFCKYINILSCVQRLSEFKKNEKLYRPMIIQEHVQQAECEIKRLGATLRQRYDDRHAQRLEEQRKQLELERAKLKVREAKLANQRSASIEPATVGWEMTIDPVTGLPQYDVVNNGTMAAVTNRAAIN